MAKRNTKQQKVSSDLYRYRKDPFSHPDFVDIVSKNLKVLAIKLYKDITGHDIASSVKAVEEYYPQWARK